MPCFFSGGIYAKRECVRIGAIIIIMVVWLSVMYFHFDIFPIEAVRAVVFNFLWNHPPHYLVFFSAR